MQRVRTAPIACSFALAAACGLCFSGCPTPAPHFECGSYACSQDPTFCDCLHFV